MANPYRSSEGLSARPFGNSDEIQLRIDPVHADLDEEISGLHSQVRRLKSVAQEIEAETKLQNDIISDLQMAMSQARAGVKNGMRRLNRTISQHGSNHILHVIIFGLVCFSIVYFWTKLSRR
ncbi:Bet1-like protein [Quillaja saponaria]|uniref:Bet1-like protein n=1 Tax=Quillaja saponaria TaxID=32244 RepID=A0AAD7P6B0_QUISA|nr:Bet1-like protein [Quillaja saponaria]